MRRALEHLTGPSIESAAGFEDRLDPASMMSATNRHVEAHHMRPWRLGLVTQRDGPGANERAELQHSQSVVFVVAVVTAPRSRR